LEIFGPVVSAQFLLFYDGLPPSGRAKTFAAAGVGQVEQVGCVFFQVPLFFSWFLSLKTLRVRVSMLPPRRISRHRKVVGPTPIFPPNHSGFWLPFGTSRPYFITLLFFGWRAADLVLILAATCPLFRVVGSRRFPLSVLPHLSVPSHLCVHFCKSGFSPLPLRLYPPSPHQVKVIDLVFRHAQRNQIFSTRWFSNGFVLW